MVTFLPTPIGNLEDITLRVLQRLKECEVLLCEDTRITKKLITLLQDRGLLTKKEYIYHALHSHNEEQFLNNVSLEFFNQEIAYLSDAGMPCISDPGAKLILFLQGHNIPYDVYGGISALTLGVAFSGIVEKEFVFLGFPPHKMQEKMEFFRKNLKNEIPFVFYESPYRLLETLELLCKIDKHLQVFLAKELTKKYQTTFFGKITEVFENLSKTNIKGEWVCVVKAEAKEEHKKSLSEEEIYSLDIPPKIKAKLLSKLQNRATQEIYKELCEK
ncbi:16S rRNA (cytidine(1402)-2'-O)-methyltransferase [Helicobacter burdigaliensis]|uniref:16S rRNA (cytidine(1402)-2'-O)-methyltransferase n=1 Tax=Helicobacter burdigaliensis TaxID=2315334 RepID=UPI000EF7250A|nr:16S rRNA (cytidine(1402)-2'-O)-methyltransferase [Helicobacter burdigaliensis]